MSNKPKRQRLQSLHLINVCVTVLTLIAVGVLALVLPKPTVSEVERRELAKKPEFTLEKTLLPVFGDELERALAAVDIYLEALPAAEAADVSLSTVSFWSFTAFCARSTASS